MNSRKQLIRDAEKADLVIKTDYKRTIILRGLRDGVIIWDDGSITRYNQTNSLTMNAKQARSVLKLPA